MSAEQSHIVVRGMVARPQVHVCLLIALMNVREDREVWELKWPYLTRSLIRSSNLVPHDYKVDLYTYAWFQSREFSYMLSHTVCTWMHVCAG